MKSLFPATWLALSAITVLSAASLTPLPPGADLTASPGQTLSWHVEVGNDPGVWMVPTAFNYETLTPVGTFTDVFGWPQFLFLLVAPGGSAQIDGPYQIDVGVPPGYLSVGALVLTYDLFSIDPNDPEFDPDTDLISAGNTVDLAASVRIEGAAQIPEPGTTVMFAAGLACLAASRWRGLRNG